MADKEGKEVKVNLAFTSEKLFVYGAIAEVIIGLVWAILAAVADSGGAIRAANFFQGFFFTVLGCLVLYGFSQIVKSKQ
jgi:hypothetical protein